MACFCFAVFQDFTHTPHTFIQYLLCRLLELSASARLPDVASVCPHSPHRHVMRSLVATLASLPMPPAGTARPVFHVTRSGSECLKEPDPLIQASLSLVILQSVPAKPKRKSGRIHWLYRLWLGALMPSRPLERKKVAMLGTRDTNVPPWSLDLLNKNDTVVLCPPA